MQPSFQQLQPTANFVLSIFIIHLRFHSQYFKANEFPLKIGFSNIVIIHFIYVPLLPHHQDIRYNMAPLYISLKQHNRNINKVLFQMLILNYCKVIKNHIIIKIASFQNWQASNYFHVLVIATAPQNYLPVLHTL